MVAYSVSTKENYFGYVGSSNDEYLLSHVLFVFNFMSFNCQMYGVCYVYLIIIFLVGIFSLFYYILLEFFNFGIYIVRNIYLFKINVYEFVSLNILSSF